VFSTLAFLHIHAHTPVHIPTELLVDNSDNIPNEHFLSSQNTNVSFIDVRTMSGGILARLFSY
jgi:hypothetical protein